MGWACILVTTSSSAGSVPGITSIPAFSHACEVGSVSNAGPTHIVLVTVSPILCSAVGCVLDCHGWGCPTIVSPATHSAVTGSPRWVDSVLSPSSVGTT